MCSGNGTEFCGSGGRLNLYKSTGANPTSSTGPGTGTSSTPTPSPTGPTITMNVGNFAYQRCATEVNGRALSAKAVASDDMTVAYCAGNCTGYTYMGVEYGRGEYTRTTD
jgi:hypothetical protein